MKGYIIQCFIKDNNFYLEKKLMEYIFFKVIEWMRIKKYIDLQNNFYIVD